MIRPSIAPPSAETIRKLRELNERPLQLEEFDRERSIPLTFEEIEENLELARWFRGRYPTGEARSAYIRQAMKRWLGGS